MVGAQVDQHPMAVVAEEHPVDVPPRRMRIVPLRAVTLPLLLKTHGTSQSAPMSVFSEPPVFLKTPLFVNVAPGSQAPQGI